MSDKNPAVLWYPADYLVGTMGMTWEQKGRYVELLNIQHQKGHLNIEKLMPDCPPEVYEKFVDSRRKNLSKKTEDKEISDAKNARKKIEGRLQQMRSPAQANIRDREDDLWRSE